MADKTVTFGEDLSFAAKEAYKRLRNNVLFSFVDDKPSHVIGVTSSGPAEGKSTTAMNLAFSLYELGKDVILIDADMRRPSVNKKLDIEQVPGLSDVLLRPEESSSVLRHYRENNGKKLDVMPAGNIPPNPAELLISTRMQRLLKTLMAKYEYVIIDLPPVTAVVDAQTVSALTDGMIIVVREGHCDRLLLDDCIAQLRIAKAKILGFVLNGAKEGSQKAYTSSYYGR